ncbi:MAG: protein translocase subunit SecF [bacterium]|nr:protein translocase subunit SecF [bacterium]
MKVTKKSVVILFCVIILLTLLAWFGLGDSLKGVREIRYGIDIRGGVEAVFEPQDVTEKPTTEQLEAARNVIEKRLDNANITDREVTVDQSGGYIIVRFPWKSDEADFNPEDAITELGAMAKLTFRDPDGNILVEGKDLKSSTARSYEQNGMTEYVVDLYFNEEGAKLFSEATGRLIGQPISIYMDETMISAPTVETQITSGQAYITGQQSFSEAENLSDTINAGALPFSLATKNFSTISPSLGQNALQVMTYAGLIAFLCVCAFMLIYYKFPGLIACFTLLLQMVLQLLAVSVPQYTLTLPGIAGIILSLGMAVDANIIISERISEEIAKSKGLTSAVTSGYQNAFSSVLDGNITTAIVAVILMIFGSGTMLSFGYTLLIGMIVNCFVGVQVSKRMLLSSLQYPTWNHTNYFREKKERKTFRFYENKKYCAIISGALILIGIIAVFAKGVRPDTQFVGGTVLEYNVEQAVDTEAVEKAVNAQTARPVTVQITDSRTDASTRLVLTLAGNEGLTPETQKAISQAVGEAVGQAELSPSQSFSVEPYIGAKALRNAITAVIISFICITLYVWIRFSAISGLSAGMMALVALLHDVAIVFFTFVLFGIPIGDSFVAVVLTIIGYSINDTIVVYDRIRENARLSPKDELVSLVNFSITQVMARSVNTFVTTAMCILIILGASVIFGITSIYQFSLPMLTGLVSGCYSSICIASVLWAMWKLHEKKKG